jgi:hypothetical protein
MPDITYIITYIHKDIEMSGKQGTMSAMSAYIKNNFCCCIKNMNK